MAGELLLKIAIQSVAPNNRCDLFPDKPKDTRHHPSPPPRASTRDMTAERRVQVSVSDARCV